MPILLGTLGKETPNAILFHIKTIKATEHAVPYESPIKQPTWFPLSQVTKMVSRGNLTDDDELHVSEWIAEKKGLYEELD